MPNDRPEFEAHIGGQTRKFRFTTAEAVLLEERLGADPLAYLSRGGGATKFVADAIFAGLSYDRGLRRELTPGKVYGWMDQAQDLDREWFQKEVLYAIARGKTGEEAKRMVRALDEAFAEGASSLAQAEAGEGPSRGG